MILKIGKLLIIKNITFFLFLISVGLYCQNNTNIDIREGIYALELCIPKSVSLCGNGFRESKIPQLVSYQKNTVCYDTIYKYPDKTIEHQYDPLNTLLFFDKLDFGTDTLNLKLNKKYRRYINRTLRKVDDRRKFNGYYSYLLYKIKFECIYTGTKKTFIPNMNLTNDEPFIEITSESFSIIKIIKIEPYFTLEVNRCLDTEQ